VTAADRRLSGDPKGRLLTIATEHLRRGGAKRVRLVAVAEEAGMTHANVYRYFSSREDLLDAVAAAALRPVEAHLADVAGAPDPADDKLERMIYALARGYRDLLEREPPVFALYASAASGNRPLARRHLGRVRRLFGDVIDEGRIAGIFEVSDRDAALAFLVDALHRFTHPSPVLEDATRVRVLIDNRLQASVRIVLRVMRAGIV